MDIVLGSCLQAQTYFSELPTLESIIGDSGATDNVLPLKCWRLIKKHFEARGNERFQCELQNSEFQFLVDGAKKGTVLSER